MNANLRRLCPLLVGVPAVMILASCESPQTVTHRSSTTAQSMGPVHSYESESAGTPAARRSGTGSVPVESAAPPPTYRGPNDDGTIGGRPKAY